jgi:hypothetical protein
MRTSETTRTKRFGAVLLVCGAVAAAWLAVAGTDQGAAARAVAPSNLDPPTITGTTRVGSTLTASNGRWNGTQPIAFAYSWRRCDQDGGSCSAISGANEKTYLLKPVDAGNTLRVRVTARNSDGAANSTSVPTGLVTTDPTPAPTGCPGGTGTIQIAQLSPPARLLIDRQDISPPVATGSTDQITARFHVTACGGRTVQGALIYVTAVPYNQFSIPPEQATGADGWAQLTMGRLRGYPATPRQQLLVMFARARKSGEDELGGISTRRLVSFPVNRGVAGPP